MRTKMTALLRRVFGWRFACEPPKMVGDIVVLSDADFKNFMKILNSSERPKLHPDLAEIKAAHDAMLARTGGY